MTLIEDFQPLIDWCTRPHPQDRPRLQRIARGDLQQWVDAESPNYDPWDPIMQAEWVGSLIYSPRSQRGILGGFAGALPGVIVPSHEAQVGLTLKEDDAWIGIQGLYIGDEWREDVHVYDYWVNDNPAADLLFRIHGNEYRFHLRLIPSYLYGG
jgi:hypothetical protein